MKVIYLLLVLLFASAISASPFAKHKPSKKFKIAENNKPKTVFYLYQKSNQFSVIEAGVNENVEKNWLAKSVWDGNNYNVTG
jgi:hypothetical protein